MTAPALAEALSRTRAPIRHLWCDRCETWLCNDVPASYVPPSATSRACNVCSDVEFAYRHAGKHRWGELQ